MCCVEAGSLAAVDVDVLAHGTTVATNVLLESSGARTEPRRRRAGGPPAGRSPEAATILGSLMLASVVQLVLAVALGWTVGHFLLRLAFGRDVETIGLAERALAGVLGFVVLCTCLMLAHIVTGGAVFRLPAIIPIVAALLLAIGARARAWPRRAPWRALAAWTVLLALIYASPVVVGGSSLRTGDTPWHMGRTNQLLGGEPVPGGPAARFDRNAYPWGFHAVLATLVRLAPGSDAEDALTALDFLILLALPLVAACLARTVERHAGWAAAASAALIGGFGWALARRPIFFTSPDAARYGADLTTASPNGVYALFPPALPREVGLILLGSSSVLLVLALREQRPRAELLAGASIGITGLMSVPMLVSASAWALAGVLALARRRMRSLLRLAGAAVIVFAAWAAPVVVGYVRLGGFVNVAPVLGREWPLATGLSSWGLLVAASAGGLVVAATTYGRRAGGLLAFTAAAAAMMALAVARSGFDWQLGGVPWLLHEGRMWPPLHLLAAALGGLLLFRMWAVLQGRRRGLGFVVVGVVMLLAAPSPLLASIGLERAIAGGGGGFIYSGPDFSAGGFIRRAAGHLGPDDVVKTAGSETLDLYLFQYSGVRVANFGDRRLAHNDARIRYRDLARSWDERVARGGFPAGYVARPLPRAPAEAEVVARGLLDGRPYVLLRAES
jgi:hypothetical protein